MSKVASFVWVIVLLVVIIAVIVGIKAGQINFMIESGESYRPPPEAVSIVEVEQQRWSTSLSAVGSLAAWQGLQINAEVSGRVSAIHFESGDQVSAGDLLVEQASGNELAQLRAATARRDLAKSNLTRLVELVKKQSVSKSALDEAKQQVESAEGDVDNLETTLSKKQIIAPFSGRLGIRQIDLGQDLQVATPIVTLQSIDKLKVDFTLPQDWFSKVKPGYKVLVQTKQNGTVNGQITATAAEIDSSTRNLRLQAVIDNTAKTMLPGMSVGVIVELPETNDVLVIPSTAVLFAPYGDTVFVVEKPDNGGPSVVRQQFIRLGDTRGDYVSVEAGLEVGQTVVSAGAFKLFNGMAVVESSNPEPERSLTPNPSDS